MKFEDLDEAVLVRIKDYDKSRTYSSLTLLLNGLASGYGRQSWPRDAPSEITVYFKEGFGATLSPLEQDRISAALREVCGWLPPGTAGVPLRYHGKDADKARSSKKAWVARARLFLEQALPV